MNTRDRLRSQWTEAAQDWIAQDQTIRTDFLDSWMLDELGDVSNKRVIDIGCGEGRFTRLLAELGADATGIDLTQPLLDRAHALAGPNETYRLADAETLDGIESQSCDLAVSYIVLVDLDDYRASIEAAYRVLRPGGAFIVCSIHPMRMATPQGWINQGGRKLFYPLDNYAQEGPREFTWWGKPFLNMHRTLSSHITAFLDAGFVLDALHEPTPSPEQLERNPHFDDEYRAPNFIIYRLRKPKG